MAGADTGTYMGGAICAIDPKLNCYVLEEFPNYHYTGDGTIELTGMTVSEWIRWFATRLRHYTKQSKNFAWADANTTFKTEVAHGFRFKGNKKDLELRTEITREYVRNRRLILMPWLEVIPYEMEEAHYPDHENTMTGKFRRVKEKDHCLDGVEHVCSRRPNPDFKPDGKTRQSAFEALVQQQMRFQVPVLDAHLGQN